jgi:hypothetical protein
MKSKHASWEEIIDVLAGGASVAGLPEHLESCARCTARAGEVREILAALEDLTDSRPSPRLVEATWSRLREVLAASAARRGRSGGLLESLGKRMREVAASLVADSMRPSPAVRGTVDAAPRTVVYETDDFAVSVSLSFGPDLESWDVSGRRPGDVRLEEQSRGSIRGQVIPRTADAIPEGGSVMLRAGGSLHEAHLSAHGEFGFRDVPKGDLEFLVLVGGVQIRLAPLQA